MEINDAWNSFYATGSVAEYLKYTVSKRAEENQLEQIAERNSDKRNGLSRE